MKVNVGIKNILTKKLYFAKFKNRKGIIKNHLNSSCTILTFSACDRFNYKGRPQSHVVLEVVLHYF